MNEIITPASPSRLAELREMDTPALKQSLLGVLRRTVEDVLETAHHILILEERGEDLSGLKIGLYDHLRKVAHGQLLPEVIVHFAGKPSLIAIIGNLPLPDQRRLAEGERVRLTVHGPTGQRTHQMADPLALTPAQVRQVFARDHIRREDEQALILAGWREKARQPVPEQAGKLLIDRERGIAYTKGRAEFTLADLKAAVAILSKGG